MWALTPSRENFPIGSLFHCFMISMRDYLCFSCGTCEVSKQQQQQLIPNQVCEYGGEKESGPQR